MFGGPETFTPNCGEVPAFAVSDIWTVAVETGVREIAGGETRMAKGAACVTAAENVVVWERVPLVPVTVTVDVPVGVDGDAAS